MVQLLLRVFFILSILAVAWSYVENEKGQTALQSHGTYVILGAIVLAAAVIILDMSAPRKSLTALSGVFFGLIAGLVISYGLSLVFEYLVVTYMATHEGDDSLKTTKVLLGVICCYLCVSFVLQTKDDIRFVIPYVEFAKELRGHRPILLDTSVIIDGRIADVCETGIIDQQLIVPRFILRELQAIADSSDPMKRRKGRRGLDVLNKLQGIDGIDVQVLDHVLSRADQNDPVDLKLLALAGEFNGRVATNDYNLHKVAKVRGIPIINLNELANALKPQVLPGEGMMVKIIKPGEQAGQGVGYLDDGTMVVIEQGRSHIGERVSISVTSSVQTSAGRMIFGRIENETGGPRREERRGGENRSDGGAGEDDESAYNSVS